MRIFIFILLVSGLWTRSYAEESATSKLVPVVTAKVTNTPISAAETAPVPVPEPLEKAVQRYRTGNIWWCVLLVWSVVVPAALLFSGFSARLRTLALRTGRKWYFGLCLYLFGLLVIVYGINWPLSFYLGFVRNHAYGLSNQTFGKWFGDSLKSLGVMYVAGVLFLWLPFWLLRKSVQRWWLYAGLAMVPVYFFSMLVEPVLVEPLFNKFAPIENKVLEAQILSLAERAGIHGSRVYQVNKSVDTKTVNAYVTGFLGTKRIVLWDTALNKLNERELLFVMGHEMGHFALGHVVKGILVTALLTFVALYGIHRTAGYLIRRGKGRFGFDELADFASIPLFMLLAHVFSQLLTPVGFAYSRHLEHEADRFGLEITHYNHSAATGFVRLQAENLSVPRPGWLFTILRGTHPAIGDRIDFFNSYRPWEKGEPGRYEKYFTTPAQ